VDIVGRLQVRNRNKVYPCRREPTPRKKFECVFCQKMFATVEAAAMHERDRHARIIASIKTAAKEGSQDTMIFTGNKKGGTDSVAIGGKGGAASGGKGGRGGDALVGGRGVAIGGRGGNAPGEKGGVGGSATVVASDGHVCPLDDCRRHAPCLRPDCAYNSMDDRP
jgi:hypothetical protein